MRMRQWTPTRKSKIGVIASRTSFRPPLLGGDFVDVPVLVRGPLSGTILLDERRHVDLHRVRSTLA